MVLPGLVTGMLTAAGAVGDGASTQRAVTAGAAGSTSSAQGAAVTRAHPATRSGRQVQPLTAKPCGTMTPPTTGAQVITHVVWVVFENKSYDDVFDTPSVDPYLTGLAHSCGVASAYSATPANASKLALTSGTDWGVTGDANVEPGPDIYSQLGTDWRQYMGGMTTNCQTGDTTTYYQHHNPPTYYTDAASACTTQDVPLPTDPTQINLSAAFTWIEGTVPQSMHGCPSGCSATTAGQLAAGDSWASKVIPALTQTSQYLSGSTVIFIVWDQASTSDPHSVLIAVSPYVHPGSVSATPFTHYSLLRGTEEYLGLPLLVHAGDKATSTVGGQFGLPGSTQSTLPSSAPVPPIIHTP